MMETDKTVNMLLRPPKMSLIDRWLKEDDKAIEKLQIEYAEEEVELYETDLTHNVKFSTVVKPFDLVWSFGVNTNTPIISLTNLGRKEVFYTSAHFGIFYDFKNRKIDKIHGHANTISSVSADSKGKYLVTADLGKDGSILIWNAETKDLLWSIFDTFEDGVVLVQISHDAKYLVAVGGAERQNEWRVKFWLWTEGQDQANDTACFKAKNYRSTPKRIDFDPNQNECFMIVFDYDVVFFTWRDGKLSEPGAPEFNLDRRHRESLNDGCYVLNSRRAIASSTRGAILVFGYSAVDTLPSDKRRFSSRKHPIFIKTVKINKSVNFIKSVDGILVTGTKWGLLDFFDKYVRLLYWMDFRLSSIVNISFDLCPRPIDTVRLLNMSPSIKVEEYKREDDEDLCQEIENLKRKCSHDASLYNKLFVVRDFFITTSCGNIFRVDFLERNCTPLFFSTNSPVAAIDVHTYFPYLLVAYENGLLIMFNYENMQIVCSLMLPFNEKVVTTYMKYCPACYHLALGTSDGTLHILEPILLKIRRSFRLSDFRIMKIVFSYDSLQMAYYDDHKNVLFLVYEKFANRWTTKGKIRAHYKPITDILFHLDKPYYLYTIGRDRFLIKYNNVEICFNEELEAIDILARDRIEQKDVPMSFQCYEKANDISYLLIADDKHKYKILNDITMMTTSVILGPSIGCFAESPVSGFEMMSDSGAGEFMVFINKCYIGLQLLPLDGNPYRYVACLAHPKEVGGFRISKDDQYVFTFGKNDMSVLMWRINTESPRKMEEIGGYDLEPYFCLLEGGKNGYLFQEMQDLFFYMQILQQGENSNLPRKINDSIHVSGLPELVRGCGYYPSEYEVENMMVDIRYRDLPVTGNFKETVTFAEFVELFINHRPAHGYLKKDLRKAFRTFAAIGSYAKQASNMDRDDFLSALTGLGEQFSTGKMYKCLSTLLREETSIDDDDDSFEFLPAYIDYPTFAEVFLGIEDYEDADEVSAESDSEESIETY